MSRFIVLLFYCFIVLFLSFHVNDCHTGQWRDGKRNGTGTYPLPSSPPLPSLLSLLPSCPLSLLPFLLLFSSSLSCFVLIDVRYTLTLADGKYEKYEGEWQADRRQGRGVLTTLGGRFEGTFKDDR